MDCQNFIHLFLIWFLDSVSDFDTNLRLIFLIFYKTYKWSAVEFSTANSKKEQILAC